MTAAAETRTAQQARREAELVSAADKGVRAFYAAAGYGKLAGIAGGTIVIALVAQHLLRKQDFLFGSLMAWSPRRSRCPHCFAGEPLEALVTAHVS